MTKLNREGWLTALGQRMHPVILERTGLRATPYQIACGWPSRQATTLQNRRVGECWREDSKDGVSQIFVTPAIDDPIEVGGVVVHELLHAFLPHDVGHGEPFERACREMDLVGPVVGTYVGPELEDILVPILFNLGRYPHRRITPA